MSGGDDFASKFKLSKQNTYIKYNTFLMFDDTSVYPNILLGVDTILVLVHSRMVLSYSASIE